ncbi:hypothetical protein CBR_g36222 [Chara braunii]|uniref:Peptidoglycan binding-like domain-containing protein n=1 Tax=Chara braunii TaxID=69332 RepID=A0A388LKE1_CHABU|nr:hypothetical protein CBR_g36222 [Chara braunii]|eukprot:GBG82692.1 hypothetical protein CBR_g36222 [Chara braunii]
MALLRACLCLLVVCLAVVQGVSATWPLVQSGDNGPNVMAVQDLLQAHGHFLTSDGIFGPITEAAVKAFQLANSLTADGIVGPLTWPVLIVTVQSGSSGAAVHAVQYLLAYKHNLLAVAGIDSLFGPITEGAVKSFQASKGLTQDGIVGPLTWEALVSGDAPPPSSLGSQCQVVLPTPTADIGPCSEEAAAALAPEAGSTAGVCTPRVTLTECQLRTIMGGACPNCKYYYPHLVKAMERFDLNCPDRIAAFLAQVRHETGGLGTLFQPSDCGAGGIHMIPSNFPSFLSGEGALADLVAQFQQYGLSAIPEASLALGTPCTGQKLCASKLVQLPENAFVTAAWWFATGARKNMAHLGCQDLRLDADAGLGTASPPTGFYQISQCIYGDITLPGCGMAQRVQYYNDALAVTNLMKQ